MSKNMTMLDRRLRTLAVAPIAVLIGVLIGPGSVASIVLYALAAVMLATSAVGYWPALLRIRGRCAPPAHRGALTRPRKW